MDTLEWTVMQILECHYEDIHGNVKVLNTRRPIVLRKDKTKYIDLLVSYKNETIILELNQNFQGNYTRNLMYAFTQVLNNYGRDDLTYYQKITRVVLVNLNWHKEKQDKERVGKEIIELPYPNSSVDGYILKIINVNLDYYDRICYDNDTKRDKLYKLLTVKEKEELKELTKNEKMLLNYNKKLINLSNNDSYREKVMDERIERNLAYQEAFFEGIEKKQQETILKMYSKKYKLEDISEIVGLKLEEVSAIINSNKENNQSL